MYGKLGCLIDMERYPLLIAKEYFHSVES